MHDGGIGVVLENDGGEGSEQLSRDAADDEDDELLRIGMLLRHCRSRGSRNL